MRPVQQSNLWTLSLDVAVPTIKFLFRFALIVVPLAVLYFTYYH